MSFLIRNDQGFSLVEMLVATLMLALVSGAGVMILSSYQDGRTQLAAADNSLAAVESTHAVLRADLLHAVPRPVRGRFGDTLPGFEGGNHMPDGTLLRLVRGGHLGALLSGDGAALERVEYRLTDAGLVRRSFARTDITPETDVRDRLLLAGVQEFLVQFDAGNQHATEWRGGSRAQPLPDLVTLRLTLISGREIAFTMAVGARS